MRTLRRTSGLIAGAILAPLAATLAFGQSEQRPATDPQVNASEAFVKMPGQTLDILTPSMRMDLIDYYKNDSIYNVFNTMQGYSHLIPPVTPDWIKVQITPVTTLTVRVLHQGRLPVVMSIYTIGDSLQAADSDIRFYDADMHELQRDRFIKIASTEDFFDFKGVPSAKKKQLLELVPFPTVEYSIGAEGNTLTATLTSGKYIGKEALDQISPYLRRERRYTWTGKKFELEK